MRKHYFGYGFACNEHIHAAEGIDCSRDRIFRSCRQCGTGGQVRYCRFNGLLVAPRDDEVSAVTCEACNDGILIGGVRPEDDRNIPSEDSWCWRQGEFGQLEGPVVETWELYDGELELRRFSRR